MPDLTDIFDAAVIASAKTVFLGPVSPYLYAILGVAVGTAILEKWLIKHRKEMLAKGVKFSAFVVGGYIALSALLKCGRYALYILR